MLQQSRRHTTIKEAENDAVYPRYYWRLPTIEENTALLTNHINFAACVKDTYGLIILKDNDTTHVQKLGGSYTENTYTVEEFLTYFESKGAIFLPIVGSLKNTSYAYYSNRPELSVYPSLSSGGNTGTIACITVHKEQNTPVFPDIWYKDWGLFNYRLVRTVEEGFNVGNHCIEIAKGNLCYHVKKQIWAFKDNQYEIITPDPAVWENRNYDKWTENIPIAHNGKNGYLPHTLWPWYPGDIPRVNDFGANPIYRKMKLVNI